MQREVRQSYPNRECRQDILCRVKIRGPLVQVKPLGTHEVRAITEDQISIVNTVKNKHKEASSYKMATDFSWG